MAWNPLNPLTRLLWQTSQEQRRMQRIVHGAAVERPFLPLRRKLLEIGPVIIILLIVILCGCCEPFRLWCIALVHWLAQHLEGLAGGHAIRQGEALLLAVQSAFVIM
jgi:hypothetical protein